MTFKAKTREQITNEVVEDLSGGDENFNADEHKEQIDRITERRLKDEKFKASVYEGKDNQRKARKHYKQMLEKNKIDPKTGEQIKTNINPDDDKDKYATKEDLEKIQHRQKYPQLSDDEYNTIKAIAKAEGKSFEKTLETNEVAKNYIENTDALNRVAGARKDPSTRTKPSKEKSDEEKTEEDLSRDLPKGYNLPKKDK